jgi:hypothetical protein
MLAPTGRTAPRRRCAITQKEGHLIRGIAGYQRRALERNDRHLRCEVSMIPTALSFARLITLLKPLSLTAASLSVALATTAPAAEPPTDLKTPGTAAGAVNS